MAHKHSEVEEVKDRYTMHHPAGTAEPSPSSTTGATEEEPVFNEPIQFAEMSVDAPRYTAIPGPVHMNSSWERNTSKYKNMEHAPTSQTIVTAV